MKKIFTLVSAVLVAAAANAANITELPMPNRVLNHELKVSELVYAQSTATSEAVVTRAESNAPASITDRTFINIYSNPRGKYSDYFTVADTAKNGKDVVLLRFVEGMHVAASYDGATGTLTIPTGISIGNYQINDSVTTPIMLYCLDYEAGKYNSDPIVGKVSGDSIIFEKGVYTIVNIGGTNYYLNWMQEITSVTPNATYNMTLNGSNYSMPILMNKTASNAVSIVGMGALFGLTNYVEAPAALDVNAKTVTIKNTTTLCYSVSTNGLNTKTEYRLFPCGTTGIYTNKDVVFTMSLTDSTSVLATEGDVFLGYNTEGTSYQGYRMSNFTFDVDYNLITKEVEETGDATSVVVGDLSYNLDNDSLTAEVSGMVGTLTEVVIPNTIEANGGKVYKVTSVAQSAFYAKTSITSLTIPASIKTIGNDAFRNVNNLKTLYIEDLKSWCDVTMANGNANPIYNVFPTLTSRWGKLYFNGKEAPTNLVVPEGVTKLERTFYGFKALESVELPSTLKVLGDQAFANCEKLTEMNIPEGVETLGSAMFSCKAITKVILPKTLTSIPNSSAFYGMKALKEIVSNNPVPPACKSATGVALVTMFSSYAETVTLYVPKGSEEAYQNDEVWGVINNILASGSSVETVEVEAIDAEVEYYTLQGVKVSSENVAPGIYIVRKGNKVSKVLVK